MKRLVLRGMVLGLLLAGLVAPAAGAQDDAAVTLSVRAGFDGYYRENMWMPVQVEVANSGPAFSGTFLAVIRRYDGTKVTYQRTVELPTRSRKAFFVFVAPEGLMRQVKVTLRDGRREVAEAGARVTRADAGDLVIGVVAGSPSPFNVLADVDPATGVALVAQLEVGQLPGEARALGALDVLVFSDVDTGALSTGQREALAGWVAAGGRLLVAGGPGWQKTAAGLGPLLPLRPDGTRTLPGLAGLERFAPGRQALVGSTVVTTGALAEGAVALATQGGLALAASRNVGAGQVIYLAVDPALDPVKGWDGAEEMYRNLLANPAVQPAWSEGLGSSYYAGQAANALPGLSLPSALQLCGFLGLYVVAAGPVNYLLLRRLKRRELAWLTIPALVLAFSGLAYLIGNRVRGTSPILERLTVLQVWPDAEYAQLDSILGVFSPGRGEYQVEVGEGVLVRPLPASGGGRSSSASVTLEQGDGTSVRNLRVEAGAVGVFLAEGMALAPRFESDLIYKASGSSATLVGVVTNRSEYALEDAVLLAAGGVQRLGPLKPGNTEQVSINLGAQQASPARQSGIVLKTGPGGVAPPLPPGLRYGGYDAVITSILGTGDYYRDETLYRRYSMLSALLDENRSVAGPGGGVYLVGWAGQSPLIAELDGRQSKALDTTLVILNLAPRLEVGEGRLVLPPGLFTWAAGINIVSGASGDPAPYDSRLYDGSYSLTFRPTWPLQYTSVESLTLHLESYGQIGAAGLVLSLWDFHQGVWVNLGRQSWGDVEIEAPARFVSTSGEIRLRLEHAGSVPVNIERSDFTLVVDQ